MTNPPCREARVCFAVSGAHSRCSLHWQRMCSLGQGVCFNLKYLTTLFPCSFSFPLDSFRARAPFPPVSPVTPVMSLLSTRCCVQLIAAKELKRPDKHKGMQQKQRGPGRWTVRSRQRAFYYHICPSKRARTAFLQNIPPCETEIGAKQLGLVYLKQLSLQGLQGNPSQPLK